MGPPVLAASSTKLLENDSGKNKTFLGDSSIFVLRFELFVHRCNGMHLRGHQQLRDRDRCKPYKERSQRSQP